MTTIKKNMSVWILALAVSLSLLSATPAVPRSHPLPQAVEAQTVGGSAAGCARAWGLGLALAAAALSPCGVVCASLAWYDLALIGIYCD